MGGCQGWRERTGTKGEKLLSGYRVSLWTDRNVLNVVVALHCEYPKRHGIICLKTVFMCYEIHLSHTKKNKKIKNQYLTKVQF